MSASHVSGLTVIFISHISRIILLRSIRVIASLVNATKEFDVVFPDCGGPSP